MYDLQNSNKVEVAEGEYGLQACGCVHDFHPILDATLPTTTQ